MVLTTPVMPLSLSHSTLRMLTGSVPGALIAE